MRNAGPRIESVSVELSVWTPARPEIPTVAAAARLISKRRSTPSAGAGFETLGANGRPSPPTPSSPWWSASWGEACADRVPDPSGIRDSL